MLPHSERVTGNQEVHQMLSPQPSLASLRLKTEGCQLGSVDQETEDQSRAKLFRRGSNIFAGAVLFPFITQLKRER